MKGSHNKAIERVLIAIKDKGEGHCGDQKVFNHHMHVAIEKILVTMPPVVIEFFLSPQGHGD
jgi:hypothetical protein